VEADDDPLVMYLVVRRRTTRSFVELATAAALASRRCAARYRDDERWRDGFDDWWRDSFRKVCLRAEPRDWEAVRDLDHERVGDVACLPPVRRSARDRVLVRMQTLNDEAGALPALEGDPAPGSLTLVVATDLGMSSGKTLAQIGHAALMADLDPDLELDVVGAAADEWAGLARDAVAVVRDGGLTELPPGSETVLVLRHAHDRPGE
jgi:peptidyl-tRNA hydrolase